MVLVDQGADLLNRLRLTSLALPAGILALIVLMIVPVPAMLLDASFVLNIALSVAVLMAWENSRSKASVVSSPVRGSSRPSASSDFKARFNRFSKACWRTNGMALATISAGDPWIASRFGRFAGIGLFPSPPLTITGI